VAAMIWLALIVVFLVLAALSDVVADEMKKRSDKE
jgi:hypothetical protein